MPMLENAGGDRLARGAHSHTFKPMGEKLTREAWDQIFDQEVEPVVKGRYVFNCPLHGEFVSEREAYLSGGFPLVDEYVKGPCPVENCDETKCPYAGFKTEGGNAE